MYAMIGLYALRAGMTNPTGVPSGSVATRHHSRGVS